MYSHFLRKHFVFSLLVLVSVSCAPLDEEEEINPGNKNGVAFGIRHDKTLEDYNAIGQNQAPYNTNEYPDFNPVVSFVYTLGGGNSDEFVASGTLVAPNWILTAGHNFFVADEQSTPAPASGIMVNIGSDPNKPKSTYEVEQLIFHPTWIKDNKDFVYANDLCLVKLKTAVNDIEPASINFDKVEIIGNTVWFGGFGDYSQTSGQNADLFSPRHAYQNILDRKTDGVITSSNGVTYNGGVLAFDFDSPNGDINSLGDATVNADEQLLGAGTSDPNPTSFEGTTVQGDSGGPLFIRVNNKWVVAGVLSGGASEPISKHQDSSYGDISVFIRTANNAEWIKSVINN